jgi:hypothetical protein
MRKYRVIVTYEFIIDADSDQEAENVADGSIPCIVKHLQTDERISPTYDIEEVE